MSVKRKVEAALEALGYGAKVFDEKRYIDVYKRVYLCCSECGGIGCHVDVTVRIYKRNGRVKVFINDMTIKDLEFWAVLAKNEDEAICNMCQRCYAEWLENFIYEYS